MWPYTKEKGKLQITLLRSSQKPIPSGKRCPLLSLLAAKFPAYARNVDISVQRHQLILRHASAVVNQEPVMFESLGERKTLNIHPWIAQV